MRKANTKGTLRKANTRRTLRKGNTSCSKAKYGGPEKYFKNFKKVISLETTPRRGKATPVPLQRRAVAKDPKES